MLNPISKPFQDFQIFLTLFLKIVFCESPLAVSLFPQTKSLVYTYALSGTCCEVKNFELKVSNNLI